MVLRWEWLFLAENQTAAKGVNLKSLLHWRNALYQQALDMGVQDTHTRLLGEEPLKPHERSIYFLTLF